jgi:hypothetical protein
VPYEDLNIDGIPGAQRTAIEDSIHPAVIRGLKIKGAVGEGGMR